VRLFVSIISGVPHRNLSPRRPIVLDIAREEKEIISSVFKSLVSVISENQIVIIDKNSRKSYS